MKELKIAIHFLEQILGGENCTADGLRDLYEIKDGNEKITLEHLKAINSIISKAINYLEKGE